MRISDWSSDVCSSDLAGREGRKRAFASKLEKNTGWPCWGARRPVTSSRDLAGRTEGNNHGFYLHPVNFRAGVLRRLLCGLVGNAGVAHTRSDMNTSELQSLMHFSFAVFCLKKKN